jgi:putative glutamine amidotransferase
MQIVTHPGTGTDIVTAALAKLGADLTVVTDPATARAVPFDGLILLGGADIDPALYGEKNRYAHRIDRRRDRVECVLFDRAERRDLPILGICRGHQMLAARSGGALWQDIREQTWAVSHPDRHRVTVDGPLARRMPTDIVNSFHHQAVRAIPDGYELAAWSEDGLVEAIWRPGRLGVQWHPELLLEGDTRWMRLFRWFVERLA